MAKKGTTKYYSNKQEKQVAKDLEGRAVIGSGSLWSSKGDVRNSIFLAECKTTHVNYYSLTAATWNKIEKEAVKDGLRIPMMAVDLQNGQEKRAVIQYDDLKDFVGYEEYFPANDILHSLSFKRSVRVASSFWTCELPNFRNTKTVPHLKLCCIDWYDFLAITEGGFKSGT